GGSSLRQAERTRSAAKRYFVIAASSDAISPIVPAKECRAAQSQATGNKKGPPIRAALFSLAKKKPICSSSRC
ncbi:MAG TPA: hypothetical protein VHU79_05705, partial [Sphingomicrobium sp.]|nr:hypothetical protein [Sphingomicrobium sp.]